MKLRAPTLDDLPALAEFFAALERGGGAGAGEGEIRTWLTSPLLDPEANFRVALANGSIVGWCDVWDQNEAHERLFLDVRAQPNAREIYEGLLDWGLGRARALAGDAAVARAWGDSRDAVFAEQVQRRGFRFIRHFFGMEAELAAEPPLPVWPEGINVRTYAPGDARAVYDTNLDAFADHWDFVPLSYETWTELFLRSTDFDPTLWFIAEERGAIAGCSLCTFERQPGTGHVNILGVRPQWRRRGLGLALLLHSLRELRARGRAKADLGVDAENTTGAVRLYERAGMHVARRMDSYEKALP